MTLWIRRSGATLVVLAALLAAPRALAIPAFARKYGTSCLTCHTVYPKLGPFGEAFRRDGYRFPGVDSDYVKQETVALGQEANKKTFPNSVWPGTIPISVPLAFGANGQGLVIPSKSNTLGKQANGANFTLQDLVAEGHIWAGAAVGDKITLWGELTFRSDGSLDVEHGQVLLNDVVGPKHLLNLVVGHGFPTVTPFAPHSSYLADQLLTTVPVTGIYGVSDDPFTLVDHYSGVELTGVALGRVEYSVGVNAGKIVSGVIFPTESFYGQLGVKLGGIPLDGEGWSGPPDPLRPWAETALTLYGFAYQANSHFTSLLAPTAPPANDVNKTFGVGARGQYKSAELNLGFYSDKHNHGTDTGDPVTARVLFGELSYVLFPWLVPALRVESIWLDQVDGSTVSDLHIMPGVAFLIRPNIKLIAVGNLERSSGYPSTAITSSPAPTAWQGGAGDWVPMLAGPAGGGGLEFESIAFFLAWAI